MTTEIWIAIGVILTSLILILIVIFAKDYKKAKADAERIDEKRLNKEPVIEKMNVTVKGVNCSVHSKGFRLPELVKEFYITFETEEGKIFSIYVDEGSYEDFEEGQTGELTLVDGALLSFGLEGDQNE